MAGGEVQIESFCVVIENSQRVAPAPLDIPPYPITECCFALPALALPSGHPDAGDTFKNDKHSVIFIYDLGTVSVDFELESYVNGIWTKVADLTDDTYGTLRALGFAVETDDSVDPAIVVAQYAGFEIDWQLVITLLGEATYRIKTVETDIVAEVTNQLSFEFCLKAYLPHRANKTVRFEWYQKGILGDRLADELVFDYSYPAAIVGGDGWFNQLRLPDSFFGFNRSNYEREYVRYTNGQQVYIQDKQVEEYDFHSGMFPDFLHNYIKSDIVQADRILVTDYNSKNPNLSTLQNKAVKPNSNYEPEWNYNNRRALVTVSFVQEFQNRIKKRC